jgi:tetratricopeptide (TPR) repeat protein
MSSPRPNPPDPVAAFRRADRLLSRHRPLEALDALRTALGPADPADSTDASVHLLAGRAYLDSAQLRKAEAAFHRVIEIEPADHYARFALGKTLQRQGRLTEAETQLKIASAMDPRPEYQEALGEIRARIAVLGDRPPTDPRS